MYPYILSIPIVTIAILTGTAGVPQPGQKTGVAIPIIRRPSGSINRDKIINHDEGNSHVASARANILDDSENHGEETRAPHLGNTEHIRKRSTNLRVAQDDYDLWYGTITVGDPPKEFKVLFDTGSADIFLPGPNCKSSNCKDHKIYDPSFSSKSEDLERPFEFEFGTGTTSGDFYNDTVSIAGFTADVQTIGVARTYSDRFGLPKFHADGIMGMGFRDPSDYNNSPVFQTLVEEGKIQKPVFSFKFASPGAELYLGGINEDLYKGDFTYVDLVEDNEARWMVTLENIMAVGKTDPILVNRRAVIDTGSNYIFGPPSEVDTLYEDLGGEVVDESAGSYSVSCDAFPIISFTFEGTEFEIPRSSLDRGPVENDPTQCYCAIMSDNSFPWWIIGNTFLQGVYAMFDVTPGKSRVGFAELKM